jgi:pyruvate dehydrogenase E2 component (dihydrolipoamide acetyltransferase)
MAKEAIMPKMGQTMEEGTIVEWFVKEGDQVKKGDPLFKFESDKAALDAESPANGAVLKILHNAGAVVPILEVVALIGEPGEDISSYLSAEAAQAEDTPTAEQPPAAATPAAPASPSVAPLRAPGERVFASPRARRVAREAGVDWTALAGSGPQGRIIERDVEAYIAARPKATPMAGKLAAEAGLDLAGLAGTGSAERITRADVVRITRSDMGRATATQAQAGTVSQTTPMSGIRAIIAERMSAGAQTTAPVTLTTEVDASRLVEMREGFKKSPLAGDITPSYNDILVLIVGRVLQEQPNMNVRLADNQIERLAYVNVGVAVDTERGLLVPVIRDVQIKGLGQIASDFRELMNRARQGQSLPDDLTGGTFTITNLGIFDIDAFTPIINLPECAILGVGRIVEKPVVKDGQIAVGQRLALSLTFDHRINDGAPAARFLQRIKQLIEQPYLLLG